MKEYQIRKEFKKIAKHNKWICWYPVRVRYHQCDIFTIADTICFTAEGIKLIQLTTTSNLSARRKKIKKFLKKILFDIDCLIEVWAYDSQKHIFKIETI